MWLFMLENACYGSMTVKYGAHVLIVNDGDSNTWYNKIPLGKEALGVDWWTWLGTSCFFRKTVPVHQWRSGCGITIGSWRWRGCWMYGNVGIPFIFLVLNCPNLSTEFGNDSLVMIDYQLSSTVSKVMDWPWFFKSWQHLETNNDSQSWSIHNCNVQLINDYHQLKMVR